MENKNIAFCLVGSFLRKKNLKYNLDLLIDKNFICDDVYLVYSEYYEEFSKDVVDINDIKNNLYKYGFKNIFLKKLDDNYQKFSNICEKKGFGQVKHPAPSRILSFTNSISECFQLVDKKYDYIIMTRYEYLDQSYVLLKNFQENKKYKKGFKHIISELMPNEILGHLVYPKCLNDLFLVSHYTNMINLKYFYNNFWNIVVKLKEKPLINYEKINLSPFDMESMLTAFFLYYVKNVKIKKWNKYIESYHIFIGPEWSINYQKYDNQFENKLKNSK
jgi:hypothetical protein